LIHNFILISKSKVKRHEFYDSASSISYINETCVQPSHSESALTIAKRNETKENGALSKTNDSSLSLREQLKNEKIKKPRRGRNSSKAENDLTVKRAKGTRVYRRQNKEIVEASSTSVVSLLESTEQVKQKQLKSSNGSGGRKYTKRSNAKTKLETTETNLLSLISAKGVDVAPLANSNSLIALNMLEGVNIHGTPFENGKETNSNIDDTLLMLDLNEQSSPLQQKRQALPSLATILEPTTTITPLNTYQITNNSSSLASSSAAKSSVLPSAGILSPVSLIGSNFGLPALLQHKSEQMQPQQQPNLEKSKSSKLVVEKIKNKLIKKKNSSKDIETQISSISPSTKTSEIQSLNLTNKSVKGEIQLANLNTVDSSIESAKKKTIKSNKKEKSVITADQLSIANDQQPTLTAFELDLSALDDHEIIKSTLRPTLSKSRSILASADVSNASKINSSSINNVSTLISNSNVKSSSRTYDPEKHCGVISEQIDPQTGLKTFNERCLRSLTCKVVKNLCFFFVEFNISKIFFKSINFLKYYLIKKHPISLRRQVTGRSKTFNELFKQYRDEKLSHVPGNFLDTNIIDECVVGLSGISGTKRRKRGSASLENSIIEVEASVSSQEASLVDNINRNERSSIDFNQFNLANINQPSGINNGALYKQHHPQKQQQQQQQQFSAQISSNSSIFTFNEPPENKQILWHQTVVDPLESHQTLSSDLLSNLNEQSLYQIRDYQNPYWQRQHQSQIYHQPLVKPQSQLDQTSWPSNVEPFTNQQLNNHHIQQNLNNNQQHQQPQYIYNNCSETQLNQFTNQYSNFGNDQVSQKPICSSSTSSASAMVAQEDTRLIGASSAINQPSSFNTPYELTQKMPVSFQQHQLSPSLNADKPSLNTSNLNYLSTMLLKHHPRPSAVTSFNARLASHGGGYTLWNRKQDHMRHELLSSFQSNDQMLFDRNRLNTFTTSSHSIATAPINYNGHDSNELRKIGFSSDAFVNVNTVSPSKSSALNEAQSLSISKNAQKQQTNNKLLNLNVKNASANDSTFALLKSQAHRMSIEQNMTSNINNEAQNSANAALVKQKTRIMNRQKQTNPIKSEPIIQSEEYSNNFEKLESKQLLNHRNGYAKRPNFIDTVSRNLSNSTSNTDLDELDEMLLYEQNESRGNHEQEQYVQLSDKLDQNQINKYQREYYYSTSRDKSIKLNGDCLAISSVVEFNNHLLQNSRQQHIANESNVYLPNGELFSPNSTINSQGNTLLAGHLNRINTSQSQL
jgi:hypothetical protein